MFRIDNSFHPAENIPAVNAPLPEKLAKQVDKEYARYISDHAHIHIHHRFKDLRRRHIHNLREQYAETARTIKRPSWKRIFSKKDDSRRLSHRFLEFPEFPPEKLNALINFLIKEFENDTEFEDRIIIHELAHYMDIERQDNGFAKKLIQCYFDMSGFTQENKLDIPYPQHFKLITTMINVSCLQEADAMLHEILNKRVIEMPNNFSTKNIADRLIDLLQKLVVLSEHNQLSEVEDAVRSQLLGLADTESKDLNNLALLILLLPERVLSPTPGELINPTILPSLDRSTDQQRADFIQNFHSFSKEVLIRVLNIVQAPKEFAATLVESDLKSRLTQKLQQERLIAAQILSSLFETHRELFSPEFDISPLTSAINSISQGEAFRENKNSS